MANRWLEIWSNAKYNAEIAASASESFGTAKEDQDNRSKHGSMNFLVLSNRSDYPIKLTLDSQVYTELGTSATLIIEPDEGKYFDIVKVENLDAGNAISASLVHVRFGRSDIVTAE